MNRIASTLLSNMKKSWLSLGVALLTCTALGSVGAASAQAGGTPLIHSIYQNGNNVIVKFYIPHNTPAFSSVHTRWNGPGANSSNEYQQDFSVGAGRYYEYTIPNIQSNGRYVFKVQGYAGTWSGWNEKHFKTKGVTYRGYLFLHKKK